ncbi:hypothetical protein ACOMHN_057439 [Nucella lapillus]
MAVMVAVMVEMAVMVAVMVEMAVMVAVMVEMAVMVAVMVEMACHMVCHKVCVSGIGVGRKSAQRAAGSVRKHRPRGSSGSEGLEVKLVAWVLQWVLKRCVGVSLKIGKLGLLGFSQLHLSVRSGLTIVSP